MIFNYTLYYYYFFLNNIYNEIDKYTNKNKIHNKNKDF